MSAPFWDQWWNRSVGWWEHYVTSTWNICCSWHTVITTYLIVDHHMYCAVCGVGRQVRQVECLINDPLACERSIAVQQNRHHLGNHATFYKHLTETLTSTCEPRSAYPLALCVSTVELLRFSLSLDHWVHGFQVGRVSHEWHCDVLVADSVQPPVIHPQVILHVARSLRTEAGGKSWILVMIY